MTIGEERETVEKTDTTQKASSMKSGSKGVTDILCLCWICLFSTRGTGILTEKVKLFPVHARIEGEKYKAGPISRLLRSGIKWICFHPLRDEGTQVRHPLMRTPNGRRTRHSAVS